MHSSAKCRLNRRRWSGTVSYTHLIGIYGVLSYAVRQRTREIGIRMSLGASRGRVLGEVLREGMQLAVLGLAVGIAGAFAAGRVLARLLSEVKPGDPLIFAATAGLLAMVALIACYLPARRAARLDPVSYTHLSPRPRRWYRWSTASLPMRTAGKVGYRGNRFASFGGRSTSGMLAADRV